MEKVLLFGSFDLLHPGHYYVIKSALEKGRLTISMAQDRIIQERKGRKPVHNLKTRTENLRKKYPEIDIQPGDTNLGEWSLIKQIRPNIVIVGYDQHGLFSELSKIKNTYSFKIVQLEPFHAEKYKSSIIRENITV